MFAAAGVRRGGRGADAAVVRAKRRCVLSLMRMGGGITAHRAQCVTVRLSLTRVMVRGRQQPTADQIGDEYQIGEKTLHEAGPAKIRWGVMVVKIRKSATGDSISMSRCRYVRKIIIVRSRKFLSERPVNHRLRKSQESFSVAADPASARFRRWSASPQFESFILALLAHLLRPFLSRSDRS